MSIKTEISRLEAARNAIRTKLNALGLVTTTANIDDCATAVEGITNNGTVTKALDTSTTSYIIPKGYHSGSGKVSITTQSKTVSPSASQQTVSPDSGKLLSSVVISAIPDSARSGQYVWEVGIYTPAVAPTDPTFTLTVDSTTEMKISDASFDYTKLGNGINDKVLAFFDGFKGGTSAPKITASGTTLKYYYSSISSKNITDFDASTGTFTLASAVTSSYRGTYNMSASGTKVIEPAVFNKEYCVVSDDPNAFPDGGYVGAKYYIKANTAMERGSVTVASGSPSCVVELAREGYTDIAFYCHSGISSSYTYACSGSASSGTFTGLYYYNSTVSRYYGEVSLSGKTATITFLDSGGDPDDIGHKFTFEYVAW